MKIIAIVGSYRKGGTIDQAVDALLGAAKTAGAEASKVYLVDHPIEFCTNCRSCMQQPGASRGECIHADAMGPLLDQMDCADAIVLASPMNFGTVTAVMKRFIERLACYAYWPWGTPAPKPRSTARTKRAVLIASSAAPAFLARLFSCMVGLLKKAAGVVGAKTEGVLFIGLAAQLQQPVLDPRSRNTAKRLGRDLAR